MKSRIEKERLKYSPPLPCYLSDLSALQIIRGSATESIDDQEKIKERLPLTYGQPIVHFRKGIANASKPMRIGVVLSGGQAAGGHNVITGLFDALKKMHADCQVFGFLGGPSGIVGNQYMELTEGLLADYRNVGGFDLLGSGRTKIETPEQLEAAKQHVEALNLEGLVIIGGDDSNTNAAILAEYFLTHNCKTHVVGVPKTIDGDLRNEYIEIPFGFDTACKTYAEMIGNIERDALSAKKYYHFIKLMGRSASHITLECAFQTHPNITIIGEEVSALKLTLQCITTQIADVICARAKHGKDYGVILIPEGLIEFVPEVKALISELNQLLAKHVSNVVDHLTKQARETFDFFPKAIGEQLLLDRDPHGNVQVSHIATEQLFIDAVKKELQKRKDYQGKFSAVSHFFGYEGRSCLPSNFDANYCYALGFTSAILIRAGCNGYMSIVRNLAGPVEEWEIEGIPLTMLMCLEERKGKRKPVIRKALVDLEGELFKLFVKEREKWSLDDLYCYPGPIQLFGPDALCNQLSFTLYQRLKGISSEAPVPQKCSVKL